MAKICVTEKTAQRQEWIEKGLLELMLTKKFEQITVSDLCRHLELPRRSFYRYFQDLEDVLDSMLRHVFENMLLPPGLPTLEDIRSIFECWVANRELLDALHRSGMLEKLFDYTLRFTDPGAIEDYLTEEDLAMDLGREASLFTTSGSIAMAIGWYMDGFRKSPEEMAITFHRMLFRPLLQERE